MQTLLYDVRYAVRMLRKNPGSTAIVVITLALGIGVNTAIFSVLNGWLLRRLPVRAPEQIMVLAPEPHGKSSYLDFLDLQKQAGTFSDVFAYNVGIAGLSARGQANEFAYSSVTGNYFSALGVKPALGRVFLPGEGEQPNDALRVVLGFSYWQKKFAGDPGIVGEQVLFNGRPATVIGVTPKEFPGTFFSFEMDGYLPLTVMSPDPDASGFWTDRGDRELFVLGRLKPGISRAQAQSSIDVIAARLAAQYRATDKGLKVRVIPERLARPAAFVTSFVPFIAGLFLVLPALVLLLACMNVANILLARAATRQRELAVRAALGAGRARLIRQMLTETLLLAFGGGAAGIVLGKWAISAGGALLHSVTTTTSNFGYRLDCSLDWRVFAYALAAAILTGALVGLWPAWRAGRANVNAMLHASGPGGSDVAGRYRLRSVLVVAQVAGSLTLLIIAGLFVRSLDRAGRMDLGFDPNHVINMMLDPRQIGYDRDHTNQFYRELETRVRALPGVQSASVAFTIPLGVPSNAAPIHVEGHPLAPGEQAPQIEFNAIGPAYLQTMRIPLLHGRAFTASDDEAAPPVAIVNQTMANRFWPNQDAVGKRFRLKSATGPFIEIVGVARNGQSMWRLSPDPRPYFYVPLAQNYSSLRSLQVRSLVPPESLIPLVQEEVRKLAPDLPVIDCRTMRQAVNGLAGLFIFRLAASLAGVMGMLGLTLAVVGVYGVIAYGVSRRTHEIGVRMALGAERVDILKLVGAQALGLVFAGVAGGLVAASALSRAMRKLLLGVSPSDPLTYVAFAVLLAAVALVACWVPAHRASRVDPMVALRYE